MLGLARNLKLCTRLGSDFAFEAEGRLFPNRVSSIALVGKSDLGGRSGRPVNCGGALITSAALNLTLLGLLLMLPFLNLCDFRGEKIEFLNRLV